MIGNIHSGWRGTLKRIVINAIHLMEEKFNSNPSGIEIYICPSILKCCFEVDKDVEMLFKDEFHDINIDEFIEYRNKTKNVNELTKTRLKALIIYNLNQKYYIDTVESLNKFYERRCQSRKHYNIKYMYKM